MSLPVAWNDLTTGRGIVRRSGKWPALRRRWLATHDRCACCGRTNELEVHHQVPVHVDPTRELDWSNLLTLCEHRTWNCHLWIGHGGDWRDYRSNVVEVAAAVGEVLREECETG